MPGLPSRVDSPFHLDSIGAPQARRRVDEVANEPPTRRPCAIDGGVADEYFANLVMCHAASGPRLDTHQDELSFLDTVSDFDVYAVGEASLDLDSLRRVATHHVDVLA